MSHDSLTDDLRDQAALFALDLIEPGEAREFAAHLREGCAPCAAEVQFYRELPLQLASVTATAPGAQLRRRLLEETYPVPPGVVGIRANEGKWMAAPVHGVESKILYRHPVTREITQLVRFRPGVKYPRHHHQADEQCLVLEGDVRMGGLVYRGGDFILAKANTDHDVLTTEQGCLLLIISSPDDKYI